MTFVKVERRFDQVNCPSVEHDPPTSVILKPGTYSWQCDHCGHKQTFTVTGAGL